MPELDSIADRATMEASLKKKKEPSMEPPLSAQFDPIASVRSRHPGLTGGEVAEMAEAFGF